MLSFGTCLNGKQMGGAGVALLAGLMAQVEPQLQAQAINVPNASFEGPTTDFADPRLDSWQKTPKPFWYDETGGFLWDQLTGVFKNTASGSPDHIDNVDGNQAIFLFAVPQVGLFQDYDSIDWSHAEPTHAFDARFEVGKSYQATIGVIGGTGGMASGVTLEFSLYYRDDATNVVTLASTNIVFTPEVFSNTTHLVDFQITVPTVQPGSPWAGRRMGVQLLSTVNPALAGGYWDLDNLRLTAVGATAPVLVNPTWANNVFQVTLQSEPGLKLEVLAATDVASPVSNWTSLGTVTNAAGAFSFTDATASAQARFYRARVLP